jgi:hypothetical protein
VGGSRTCTTHPLILPSHSGHLQHTQSAPELMDAELFIMFVLIF